MTITEKILARASGKSIVSPGDVVFGKVDSVMIHDVSGPGVIKVLSEWEKKGNKFDGVWDPDKLWVSEDHSYQPPIEYLLKILLSCLDGQDNMGYDVTSNMAWDSMAFVTRCHMRKV